MKYFLLAGFVSACTLAAQSNPGAGSIEGHVFNSVTSAPIRKATVMLTTLKSRPVQFGWSPIPMPQGSSSSPACLPEPTGYPRALRPPPRPEPHPDGAPARAPGRAPARRTVGQVQSTKVLVIVLHAAVNLFAPWQNNQ